MTSNVAFQVVFFASCCGAVLVLLSAVQPFQYFMLVGLSLWGSARVSQLSEIIVAA